MRICHENRHLFFSRSGYVKGASLHGLKMLNHFPLNAKLGRRTEDDITVFDATGLALMDLVTGKIAIDLAKNKGLGTIVKI